MQLPRQLQNPFLLLLRPEWGQYEKRDFPLLFVAMLCQNYTSTAHSPQRTVKTLTQVEAKVEDGDYETRREDGDLPFPNSNPCIIIGH